METFTQGLTGMPTDKTKLPSVTVSYLLRSLALRAVLRRGAPLRAFGPGGCSWQVCCGLSVAPGGPGLELYGLLVMVSTSGLKRFHNDYGKEIIGERYLIKCLKSENSLPEIDFIFRTVNTKTFR